MTAAFQVTGTNASALFTLRLHRGESMVLLGMNWREGQPPNDFVGFAIEYMQPGGQRFYPLMNRLAFEAANGAVNPNTLSSRLSPFQKFRWVHFPQNAELAGIFTYRVTPVFMDEHDVLSYGAFQEAAIELGLYTYDGELNVAFTRGFVSSQAFVDRYETNGSTIDQLIPANADEGLTFKPTHPDAQKALAWMGFEARSAILGLLDEAIADETATVKVVAYDLNVPDVVSRLQQLKGRLQIIIDNSGSHKPDTSAESQAEVLLKQSAGDDNVRREHMLDLQHNKFIVVDGQKCQAVVCGSTNFSWRAFYVQANNAVVVRSTAAVKAFQDAFNQYWTNYKKPSTVLGSDINGWTDLGIPPVSGRVTFSPHDSETACLDKVAEWVQNNTKSSVLFSLAFLYQTPGAMLDAFEALAKDDNIFVYGMSDKPVKGLDLVTTSGHMELSNPANLARNVPAPFKQELSEANGVRLHHKFIVTDFNTPSARVFMGSYNFSTSADLKNGENLVVFEDQRVATAYMVEALRLFDHYEFRVREDKADKGDDKLLLAKPPRKTGEFPWWQKSWTEKLKARDRILFS